jgi:phosphoribosylanthranilate isomerase
MRDRSVADLRARELIANAPAPDDPCRIKLCGMSRTEDVAAANACHPDLVGFIVDVPRSHRSVSVEGLSALVERLDSTIPAVGVFVDEPIDRVGDAVAAGVNVVQLHGDEDEPYLAELRGSLPQGTPVIQAFRVRGAEDVERANISSADLVLLDAGQGSGKTFDWTLLAHATRPYLLAGGLGPDNVADAIRELHPWGVDMSSGIETDRRKDPGKMAAAVAAARGETR